MKKYIYFIIMICLLYSISYISKSYIDVYDNKVIVEGYKINKILSDSLNTYSHDNEIATCIIDDFLKDLDVFYINESYFNFEKYVIIKGRVFIKEDRLNRKNYGILNKEYAIKEFGSTDVIGKKVIIDNIEFEIIGVIRNQYIHSKIFGHKPTVYVANWSNINLNNQYVKIMYDEEHIYPINDIGKILGEVKIIKLHNILRPLRNSIIFFLKNIIIYLCIRIVMYLVSNYQVLRQNYIQNIQNMYLEEWIYMECINIFKVIGIIGILGIGIYLNSMLNIEIDPNYIPNSLLAINEIKTNILQYIQNEKQILLYEKNIVYEIKILIYYVNLINLTSTIILYSKLYKKILLKRYNNLKINIKTP